jgi:exopolyphosphatase/guanosine-5'-triphosphate,3'-diphosphate pyrophosphatase
MTSAGARGDSKARRGKGKRAKASATSSRQHEQSRAVANTGRRSVTTPRTLAVVDVGSRALRMAVAEVQQDNPIRHVEDLSARVAIGVDTFARGSIRAFTTEAVVKTLQDFARVLAVYGIEPADCRAAATTAVRDARNREVFLDRVESRTGFRIEVIEAIEETRLIYQLMTHLLGPRLERGGLLVLGLGAGGTHVIVQHDGQVTLAETLHFGMLRLREGRGGERVAIRSARRFLDKVVKSVDRFHHLGALDTVVVVNTELHKLVAALAQPRRTSVSLQLRRGALDELGEMLDQSTTMELADDTALDHAEAELARLAFEELRAFVEPTRARTIVFPSCTMLDSLLLDTQLRFDGPGDGAGEEKSVMAAAWSVARRYRVDTTHAAKVADLALSLFDGLRGLIGLGDRSRLLLSIAAILHDVGLYVSTHAHEEHSSYLVSNSEVMGLSQRELERVALIVRYHRRPMGNLASVRVEHLPTSERVEALKLIALLRLASALDADYAQRVRRVAVRATADEIQVLAETTGDNPEGFNEIARVFDGRSDLCDELFGMTARLTEVLAI